MSRHAQAVARTSRSRNPLEQRRQFGRFLRKLREHRGLTLQQLGELSKVSYQYIWKFEDGRRGCGPLAAQRLADALRLQGSEESTFLSYAAASMVSPATSVEAAAAGDNVLAALEAWLTDQKISSPIYEVRRPDSKSPRAGRPDLELLLADGSTVAVELRRSGAPAGGESNMKGTQP